MLEGWVNFRKNSNPFLGFYCPSGTGSNWEPCKIGTYGQATGLASEFDCMPCDPGQYCDTPGANTTSGPCEARHFCRNGSSTDRPVGTDGEFLNPFDTENRIM